MVVGGEICRSRTQQHHPKLGPPSKPTNKNGLKETPLIVVYYITKCLFQSPFRRAGAKLLAGFILADVKGA